MNESQRRCEFCHNVGWYLDYSGGGNMEPLMLELLPCLLPECAWSGLRIDHLSLNAAAFNRCVEQDDIVTAVGRTQLRG